jgi:hypothetical protein
VCEVCDEHRERGGERERPPPAHYAPFGVSAETGVAASGVSG